MEEERQSSVTLRTRNEKEGRQQTERQEAHDKKTAT
jgi:hypothetical protein